MHRIARQKWLHFGTMRRAAGDLTSPMFYTVSQKNRTATINMTLSPPIHNVH